MKVRLTFFFILFISMHSFAQRGKIIGIGLSTNTLAFDNDLVKVPTNSFLVAHANYEFVLPLDFTAGIEANYGLDKVIRYFDFNFKVGWILRGDKRLQIPLFPYIGYRSIKKNNEEKLSGTPIGVQTGIRFYTTPKMALEGFVDLSGNNITDPNDSGESLGNLTQFKLGISLKYYFTKS